MTPSQITSAITSVTGVTLEQMRDRTRVRNVSDARRMACGLMRKHTPMTLAAIGVYLNRMRYTGGDHCTVLNYIRTDAELMRINKEYAATRSEVLAIIRSQITAKELWSNLWEGVKNNFCLGVVGM